MNSKARSAAVADLGDIIDYFSKLEEADKLPRFAVLAEDLHLHPWICSEDIDIVSIGKSESSTLQRHIRWDHRHFAMTLEYLRLQQE